MGVLDNYAIPGGGAVWNKFGRTENADNGVTTDVWDRANATDDQAIWLAPTAPRIHSIVSGSADDKSSGNGSSTILIFGYTAWDKPPVIERVVLNGTTPVNTVNEYVAIDRMQVNSVNTGKITATAATDSTVTAQINAGNGQTQMALKAVGYHENAYITNYVCSILRPASNRTALLQLAINTEPDEQSTSFKNTFAVSAEADGSTSVFGSFEPYALVPGPAMLKAQTIANANDTTVFVNFDVIITPKPGNQQLARNSF